MDSLIIITLIIQLLFVTTLTFVGLKEWRKNAIRQIELNAALKQLQNYKTNLN